MFINGFVIFCFAGVAMSGDLEEHAQQYALLMREQCIPESGVKEELIADFSQGIFSEDQSLKCYMKCQFSMFAKFKEDGTLDTDTILRAIPSEYHDKYVELVNKCANIVGKDHCDTSYLTHRCYYETNPDLHFLL